MKILLTITASAIVTVALLAQGPPADATKGGVAKGKRVAPPARIIEFRASKATTKAGEEVQLVWSTENPNSVTITPDVGRVTPRGTRLVHPKATTTYTLSVTGPGQELKETVTVTIPGTTPVIDTAVPQLSTEIPRIGGHPDLSGVWAAGGGGGGGRGAAAAPAAPNALPGTPTARAGKEKMRVVRAAEDAGQYADCMPLIGPGAFGVPYQFQFVQNADSLVLFYEYPGVFRIIPIDGTPHEVDPDPTWLGDSVGHWEGDTLVVDAIGFNTKTEVNGFRHSDSLHIIEKFKRTSASTIEYEAILEDPEVFTGPWRTARSFSLRPDLRRIGEFVCENNKDYSVLFKEYDASKDPNQKK